MRDYHPAFACTGNAGCRATAARAPDLSAFLAIAFFTHARPPARARLQEPPVHFGSHLPSGISVPPRVRLGLLIGPELGVDGDMPRKKNPRLPFRRFNTDFCAPLPPLAPYQRCNCGSCRTCLDNEKWDRVFAKFEIKQEDHWETKGMFQSTLRGW